MAGTLCTSMIAWLIDWQMKNTYNGIVDFFAYLYETHIVLLRVLL